MLAYGHALNFSDDLPSGRGMRLCVKTHREREISACSFPRQAFSQFAGFIEAAVPVGLSLARGFLVTGILGPKLTGGYHLAIGTNLTGTASLETWLLGTCAGPSATTVRIISNVGLRGS